MARCRAGVNTSCPDQSRYDCYYCLVAFNWASSGELVDDRITCSSISPLGQDVCSPTFPCPEYVVRPANATLHRSSPGCPPIPGDQNCHSGGGLGCCGCGTLKLFCACYQIGGVANLSTIAAENESEVVRFLEMGSNATNISVYEKLTGQSCISSEPSGACCHEANGQQTCRELLQCGCASQTNSEFYKGKTCAEVPCGPDKRCCHCDWCCRVGSGGITESQCTSAGGTVQTGNCPASGPCPGSTCPPCELDGFSLAVNNGTNAFAEVSGYQPIATIRAIDDTGPVDTVKTMHASLSCRDGENAYAAQSCNIYNRRIGTSPESRRAVSECSLSAVGDGNVYQFICAYREPCKEPPAGCVRAAA